MSGGHRPAEYWKQRLAARGVRDRRPFRSLYYLIDGAASGLLRPNLSLLVARKERA